MRIEFDEGHMVLVLSRRNLRTLLAKLDGHPPGSACTIQGGPEAGRMLVRAEEDSEHYASRPPGRMHGDTERVL